MRPPDVERATGFEYNINVDEFEMEEIKSNAELNKSIKRGLADMKSKRGKLVG